MSRRSPLILILDCEVGDFWKYHCVWGVGPKENCGKGPKNCGEVVENQWEYDVRRGRFVEFHSMVWFWAPAVDRTGVQPFSKVISWFALVNHDLGWWTMVNQQQYPQLRHSPQLFLPGLAEHATLKIAEPKTRLGLWRARLHHGWGSWGLERYADFGPVLVAPWIGTAVEPSKCHGCVWLWDCGSSLFLDKATYLESGLEGYFPRELGCFQSLCWGTDPNFDETMGSPFFSLCRCFRDVSEENRTLTLITWPAVDGRTESPKRDDMWNTTCESFDGPVDSCPPLMLLWIPQAFHH